MRRRKVRSHRDPRISEQAVLAGVAGYDDGGQRTSGGCESAAFWCSTDRRSRTPRTDLSAQTGETRRPTPMQRSRWNDLLAVIDLGRQDGRKFIFDVKPMGRRKARNVNAEDAS